MVKKAIALFSGGLDSMLAVRIMQKQGFEVEAFNVITPFVDQTAQACQAAEELGITCCCEKTDASYLEILRHPKYGFGKAINPCLDCHLFMTQMAKRRLETTGADVLITGEVLGQRPMSQQQHQLEMLEYHSGLSGRLIRPISAKMLPPTQAELTGVVDRAQLYGFRGRARSPLQRLARELGIENPIRPGAGCCLTERSFAGRVRDLLKHENELTEMWEYEMLRWGRCIRMNETTRCVLGRDEADCEKLNALFMEHGRLRKDVVYIEPETYMGPSAMLIGEINNTSLDFLRMKQISYSKNVPMDNIVFCQYYGDARTLEKFEPKDSEIL